MQSSPRSTNPVLWRSIAAAFHAQRSIPPPGKRVPRIRAQPGTLPALPPQNESESLTRSFPAPPPARSASRLQQSAKPAQSARTTPERADAAAKAESNFCRAAWHDLSYSEKFGSIQSAVGDSREGVFCVAFLPHLLPVFRHTLRTPTCPRSYLPIALGYFYRIILCNGTIPRSQKCSFRNTVENSASPGRKPPSPSEARNPQITSSGDVSSETTTGRTVSQSVRTRSHSWISIPLASKKPRMRDRSHPATSSRIGASTPIAFVLSTVRLAICETCGDSDTAMVRPSRAFTCSIT